MSTQSIYFEQTDQQRLDLTDRVKNLSTKKLTQSITPRKQRNKKKKGKVKEIRSIIKKLDEEKNKLSQKLIQFTQGQSLSPESNAKAKDLLDSDQRNFINHNPSPSSSPKIPSKKALNFQIAKIQIQKNTQVPYNQGQNQNYANQQSNKKDYQGQTSAKQQQNLECEEHSKCDKNQNCRKCFQTGDMKYWDSGFLIKYDKGNRKLNHLNYFPKSINSRDAMKSLPNSTKNSQNKSLFDAQNTQSYDKSVLVPARNVDKSFSNQSGKQKQQVFTNMYKFKFASTPNSLNEASKRLQEQKVNRRPQSQYPQSQILGLSGSQKDNNNSQSQK